MSVNARNPVIVHTRKLPVPNANINISYPVVSGTNTAAQQKINNEILRLVHSLMDEQVGKLIQQGYHEIDISVTGLYELKNNQRGILSLTISNYTMASPAAHGLTIIKALTFDTETGKSYSLSEQFKPSSNYVMLLSNIIKEQIKERDIPLINDFTSIKPDQDYYIADKSLVIFFQLYDLTPYVYGFPMFPISVYSIEGDIRDGSPLSRMDTND